MTLCRCDAVGQFLPPVREYPTRKRMNQSQLSNQKIKLPLMVCICITKIFYRFIANCMLLICAITLLVPIIFFT